MAKGSGSTIGADVLALVLALVALAVVGLLVRHGSNAAAVEVGAGRSLSGVFLAAEGQNPAAVFGT